MLVAATITVLGLLSGVVIVQATGLRMGGVLVVPLLAVYSLYTFAALPLFVVSAAVAYVGVGVIQARTLIHGRQRLLLCLGLGGALPVANALAFEVGSPFAPTRTTAFFGTIIPGMAAYNYHALDPEDRLHDVAISAVVLAGLLGVGAVLVSSTLSSRLDPTLTAMLFTPASDVAQVRGAVRGNVMLTTSLTREASLALLAVGLCLTEAVHARWGLRMGGLIVIPLVVVFAMSNVWTLPVYVVGVAVVFAALRALNALTLVYGRVLLTIGLVVSLVYAVAVAVLTTTLVGFLLYFTSLVAAVTAYNVHLVAPPERAEMLTVMTGLFSLLLIGGRTLLEPAEGGALASVTPVEVFGLLVALGVAVYTASHLERRRRRLAPSHGRGFL